jgi:hypothetical protein
MKFEPRIPTSFTIPTPDAHLLSFLIWIIDRLKCETIVLEQIDQDSTEYHLVQKLLEQKSNYGEITAYLEDVGNNFRKSGSVDIDPLWNEITDIYYGDDRKSPRVTDVI